MKSGQRIIDRRRLTIRRCCRSVSSVIVALVVGVSRVVVCGLLLGGWLGRLLLR